MIENRDDLKKKLINKMGSDTCPFIVIKGDHEIIAEVCMEVASELNRQITRFKQGIHDVINDVYGFTFMGTYYESPFTKACAQGRIVLISRLDQSEYRALFPVKPAIDHGHYYEGGEVGVDYVRGDDDYSRPLLTVPQGTMKDVMKGFKIIASVSDMEWMYRWADSLVDLALFLDASNIGPE